MDETATATPPAAMRVTNVVDAALAAQAEHVFATTTTCICGYPPSTGPDWDRHRMVAAVAAIADWLAQHASPTLVGDPFIRAVDWAADLIRKSAADSDTRAAPSEPRSENVCGRCDGPNIVWSAPSPLWNAVMRSGSINGDEEFGGIVCPTCFAVLAQERGIASLWYLTADRIGVELEVVTPSGRVWDEATRLWLGGP